MPKRTRSRERFPIGEWAHSVKCKCLEAVEASRSLEHIQQQITGVKETTRILKENNAQLHDEVNELKRKVATRRYIFVYCSNLCDVGHVVL